MKKGLLYLIICLGCFYTALSQDPKIRFQGFLDSYHAIGLEQDGDFLSSRTRFRPEIVHFKGNTKMFFSANLFHNYVVPELTEFFIREGYLYYSHENFSFWLGRQVITFGQSDGLPISDFISPLDLVEFLARDYDDIRIGVDAIRLRYAKKGLNTDFYFVPVPLFNRLPIPGTPWGVDPVEGISIDNYVNVLPEKNIKNSEIGLRGSFYLRGVDFSAMYLSTWNKMPLFKYVPSATPHIDILYHKLNLVSLDFAKPIGKVILKGEFAHYFDKVYQTTLTGDDEFKKAKAINGMVGLDITPGRDWTIAIQMQNEFITNYSNDFIVEKNNVLGTFYLSKNLFRNTLIVSTQSMFRFSEESAFNRFSIDYALNNEIHLSVGHDLFWAEKEGLFKQYEENDELWIKFKYSF